MHILHFLSGPHSEKTTLVAAALARRGHQQTVVHASPSGGGEAALFPCPLVDLLLGSGSAADESAAAMIGLERLLVERRPDVVVMYGDDDATLAATLAAVKLGVTVARVEAGVRTDDRSLAGGTNRMLIDRLASLLFTASQSADHSLSCEGIEPDRVRRVGPISSDGDAAERIADHLEADVRSHGAAWSWNGEDLKAEAVERIIEA